MMLSSLTENLGGKLAQAKIAIMRRLFGDNNEKIDFLMDSFYKLEPNQRVFVLSGAGAVLVGAVGIILGIYFSSAAAIEGELDQGFDALYSLQDARKELSSEGKRYSLLLDNIRKKSRALAIKPFIEKTAKNTDVTIRDLSERSTDLPADVILSEELKFVNANLNLSKVSVPRLITFLLEIERSKSFLTVDDLQIRSRHSDKLFFDAKLKIRGYGVE
jgi:hypothetical protein